MTVYRLASFLGLSRLKRPKRRICVINLLAILSTADYSV
jgi:hypothetical protein